MAYKSHSRAVSDLKAHLVLTTKYRRKVITAPMLIRLNEIFEELCRKWGCEIVEFDGESDHVHLLFSFYPQMQLSKFVNNLKTVSSIYIRKEFVTEVQKFYRKPVFWHSAYFIASCGGVTVEELKRYVREQDSPVDVEDPVGNSSRR
ncbi:MAG: IS200/IS605 family transposase [Gloeocapsa sp. UFS-A4-WI-NPMV-4B04]|jgi:putative transposase|nr:IS200/IS605 family transposase [Gloeocapsa sp. UFS-A4-WI-NPMV-4B04]